MERRAASGRIQRAALEGRVEKALQREHLSDFVVATVKENRGQVSLTWHVDAARRRLLERTRLGRRVLCSDHHNWSNGRIVHAFRGQWNVEELFRRAKKGGIAPWGPSHQWADNSLRLHTFATVIGLTLVRPGSPDARQPEVSTEHHEDTLRSAGHPGTGADEGTWSPRDGHACAGRNRRTAQGNQDL